MTSVALHAVQDCGQPGVQMVGFREALGLGCAHLSQSVEVSEHIPITTQQKHHVPGVSSIILGDTGQEKGL